jgi:hypothetical protein
MIPVREAPNNNDGSGYNDVPGWYREIVGKNKEWKYIITCQQVGC